MNKAKTSRTVLTKVFETTPVTANQVRELRIPDVLPLRSVIAGDIHAESLWLEQSIGDRDRWRAAYRLVQQLDKRAQPRFVIAEVRIYPATENARPGEWPGTVLGERAASCVPSGGLPARTMDLARSRQALARVEEHLERLRQKFGSQDAPHAFMPSDGKTVQRSRRPGRPPALSSKFYRSFALEYIKAEQGQLTQSTRLHLAERYGQPVTTIANWLRRCRQLGYLPKTRPGQRGRANHWLLAEAATALAATGH